MLRAMLLVHDGRHGWSVLRHSRQEYAERSPKSYKLGRGRTVGFALAKFVRDQYVRSDIGWSTAARECMTSRRVE